MNRYAVFIDGGYAKKIYEQFKTRISYVKFSDLVAKNQERLRTYYYDCPPFVGAPPSADERERRSTVLQQCSIGNRDSRCVLGASRNATTMMGPTDTNRRWSISSWPLILFNSALDIKSRGPCYWLTTAISLRQLR